MSERPFPRPWLVIVPLAPLICVAVLLFLIFG
jgi:hypothetical protein